MGVWSFSLFSFKTRKYLENPFNIMATASHQAFCICFYLTSRAMTSHFLPRLQSSLQSNFSQQYFLLTAVLLWPSATGAAQVSENHSQDNQGSTPANEISAAVCMAFREPWVNTSASCPLRVTTEQSSSARNIGPNSMETLHNHKLTDSQQHTLVTPSILLRTWCSLE